MMAKPASQPDLFHPRSLQDLPSLRDDLDLMSHPFFALEKGRTEPMEFNGMVGTTKTHVKITGSDYGIANQWDNDILIYLRAGVIDAINAGHTPSRRMRFAVYDCLRATKRGISGRSYERFGQALQRLKATSIITNVSQAGWTSDRGVSWIDSYEFVTRETARGNMMAACEIEVSEWAFKMMTDVKRALTVDPAYFDITGALERKLYGIARKFCGNQRGWSVGLEKLRDICGSTRPVYRFRKEIHEISERQTIPGYSIELSERPADIGGVRSSDIRLVTPATNTLKNMKFVVVRPRYKLIEA